MIIGDQQKKKIQFGLGFGLDFLFLILPRSSNTARETHIEKRLKTENNACIFSLLFLTNNQNKQPNQMKNLVVAGQINKQANKSTNNTTSHYQSSLLNPFNLMDRQMNFSHLTFTQRIFQFKTIHSFFFILIRFNFVHSQE